MTATEALQSLKLALSQADGSRATIHPTRLQQIITALEPLVGRSAEARWCCFHCSFTTSDEHAAREHFGPTRDYISACQSNGGQWGLMLRYDVRNFFNGLESGAFKIETDQDEALERVLAAMRFSAKQSAPEQGT